MSRVRWVQYNEKVIGDNHPTLDDVDNRPLQDIIQFSNGNADADDFPGFLITYVGSSLDPNGLQNGNIGNAYYSTATGILWVKKDNGDGNNTGWVAVRPSWEGCDLNNTTDINVSTGTDTWLTFDTEVVDTDGYHSLVSNTGRITIPVGKGGYFDIFGHVRLTTSGTLPALQEIKVRKNGTLTIEFVRLPVLTNKAGTIQAGQLKMYSAHVPLADNDYIELGVFHDTGGTEQAKGTATNIYSNQFKVRRVANL